MSLLIKFYKMFYISYKAYNHYLLINNTKNMNEFFLGF
jgi:hypothetical protein